jgi:hypothetical protein
VLDEFGTMLRVSDWWGHNWDALNDVLRDFWVAERPTVLTFRNAEAIGSNDEGVFGTLTSILRSVAWQSREVGRRSIHVTMLAEDREAFAEKIVGAL